MNKTLMLVICDFLLLSMLALARFDPPEESPEAVLDVTTASATAEAELISLLEESLQSELETRSTLSEDLTETRQDLEEQARNLAEREAALSATQKNLEAKVAEAAQLAEAKATIEAEQAKLAKEKALVEAERQTLAQRFESTRTELENAKTERIELAQTLGQLKEESSVSKERLTQAEKDLIAREVALAQREAELQAAKEEARRLNQEREALNQQLKVAQAERSLLAQNLTKEKLEKEQALAHATRLTENVSELGAGVTQLGQGVSQLGQGVSQLGQGVTELTQSSEEIINEMDASRPRTMSEIFTRFQNNRATMHFTSTEKPRIGSARTQTYESKSIVIEDSDGNYYLVTHTADTPFAFSKRENSVLAVSMDISIGNRTFPVSQIGFLSTDPRLIFVPLPKQIVQTSGIETFQLALQPERWEEAVLVKNDESNFGRTGFRRLTSSDRFLKMDRPALGELFSDFASSRGDLAFTKNNQFIGVLTDSNHAVVINAFLASAITDLGAGFDAQKNTDTINRLKDRVRKLPDEVQ
jgi:uncharacterized protein YoxC